MGSLGEKQKKNYRPLLSCILKRRKSLPYDIPILLLQLGKKLVEKRTIQCDLRVKRRQRLLD
jgi:hypothetical protein